MTVDPAVMPSTIFFGMSECEEIATTINRLVKAGYIAKAQELLELSLDDYFVRPRLLLPGVDYEHRDSDLELR